MYCRRQSGFTLIELLVTIVIMMILIGLATVGVTAQQANARDNERKTDAENIARGLERYYKSNGKYPDTTTAAGIVTNAALPEVEKSSYYFSFNSGTTPSFTTVTSPATGAVNDASIPAAVTTNTIGYLPMTWSNANAQWELCDTTAEDCSRYALYYKSEVSSATTILRSRQQQ